MHNTINSGDRIARADPSTATLCGGVLVELWWWGSMERKAGLVRNLGGLGKEHSFGRQVTRFAFYIPIPSLGAGKTLPVDRRKKVATQP